MSIIPARPARRRHDFTLTMINIVFLLLLFFLTTGSLTNRNEAQTVIPVTRNLPLERLPRPLLLIESDGTLLLDGERVTPEEVSQRALLALEAVGRDDAVLSLLAQRDMAATDFLAITEILRANGVPVQIVTLRETAGGGGP